MTVEHPVSTKSRPIMRLLLTITGRSLFFALLVLPSVALGQTSTATLSGTVTDPNGAVVPGVTVTITDPATRLQRTTTTNDAGQFVLPLLSASKYNLTLEHEGFMTAAVNDIVLNVGDERSLKIQMKVGDVKETVNVTGEAPLINESAAVGTVVDRQFVANIPLNGRSFQSLITLTPGVVTVPNLTGGVTSGQISVNGQRANANAFMVDGVSANFGTAPGLAQGDFSSGSLPGLTTFGTTQSLASVDEMQEFKVLTSTYSAEYGRQPGGQISIATRSGTNAFHGSVFEYFRNDVFDANDWFANANRQPKPRERQNDFGGTFSGPVILPRFGEGGHQPAYNGRNRTFFFFSYEGLRLRQPQFATSNVPTLALRQSARPAMQPLLNAFPLPNGRDLGNGFAEFASSFSNPSELNATGIRIDHMINQKWSIFGRYRRAPSETIARSGGAMLTSLQAEKTQTITLGLTSLLNPRLTNDFRINYSDNYAFAGFHLDNFGGAVAPPRNALIPSQYDSASAVGVVSLSVSGTTASIPSLILRDTGLGTQRQFNVVDSVSVSHGSHQFKFGLDFRRVMPVYTNTSYELLAIFTSLTQIQNAAPGTVQVFAAAPLKPRYDNFSAYGEDTWKVSRRLTLDLGLRWDVNPAPGDAGGNRLLAVTEITNLSSMQIAPFGRPAWRTTYNNFAPRVGVAYQLRQQSGREMIIRGGFGLFYDTGNNQTANGAASFPFTVSRTVPGATYPFTDAQVAPPALVNLSNPTAPYGTNFIIFDPNLKLPYTMQWNFSVEQSLGKKQVVSASYVGAAGRRLLQQRQITLTSSTVHINSNFTTVKLTTNSATSDYDALQLQYQRRLSRGLQALVSYTWSHALDDDSSDMGSIIPVRGNAVFDVRHNFATAVTYDIPTPSDNRVLEAVLSRWSVDTSIHARTAFPVDITGTSVVNPADGALVAPRVNLIAGVPLYIYDPSLPGGRKINRAAFSIPATGTFGNLGRNVLRGLGAWQVDFALRRQFRLTEKLNLQFRAESFNIFNHPNFGAISTTLSAANFGQATNMLNAQLGGLSALYQIGGPRSFQFAAKLQF